MDKVGIIAEGRIATIHHRLYKWLISLAVVLSILSLAVLIYLLVNPAFNDWSFSISPSLAENLGSLSGGLVGPLLSLVSILLLLATITMQSIDSQRQRFDSMYFEMLNLHRRNIAEMTYRAPFNTRRDIRARRVLREIHKQFGEIFEYIRRNHSKSFNEREQIDITYLILFFGPTVARVQYLQRYLRKEPALEQSLNYLYELRTKDQLLRKYTGHQDRLGNYYRHLYQSVTFIDKAQFLSEKEKYAYVKLLRAQLSTLEQVLFLFNSLSAVGMAWRQISSNSSDSLVIHYKLIKNLSPGITFNIDPKTYYAMQYEFEEFPTIEDVSL